ncbi:ScbA/BarX family gamma-butyrolactone biosynthesis protein [Streptomyces sp. NPDC058231]|uniref:ScbA/BarX family gamma-butyrolactone biosynthesis protein n=1 Tax=Streptomyces sp. NPDC058231 TaxID=3346392 RepID=UPI0036F12DB2
MIQLTSRSAVLSPIGRRTEFSGQLVHRSDAEDIFPTGWTRQTDTRFSVSARWPRTHRFFAPVSGRYQDPLLIAETMRQTTMLLSHAEFDVPVGDQFVMWELRYVSAPDRLVLGAARDGSREPGEGAEVPSGAWDITVDVSCSRIRRRGSGLGSMQLELLLHRSGRRIAAGGGRISCTSARVYERLRGDRRSVIGAPLPLLPSVAPHEAGRTSERDVVLSPTPRRNVWKLRLDTGHPTLFARPNDHVPGILLLEAARQAANVLDVRHAFLPTAMDNAFLRYVELDRPCLIEARTVPSGDRSTTRVQVRATQDGEPVFTSTLDSPAAGGGYQRTGRA